MNLRIGLAIALVVLVGYSAQVRAEDDKSCLWSDPCSDEKAAREHLAVLIAQTNPVAYSFIADYAQEHLNPDVRLCALDLLTGDGSTQAVECLRVVRHEYWSRYVAALRSGVVAGDATALQETEALIRGGFSTWQQMLLMILIKVDRDDTYGALTRLLDTQAIPQSLWPSVRVMLRIAGEKGSVHAQDLLRTNAIGDKSQPQEVTSEVSPRK